MSDDHASLRKQLANAEKNLRLIRERISEFVQQSDVPLQLVREEEQLVQRIEELRAALGETAVTPPSAAGPSRWKRLPWPALGGVVLLLVALAGWGFNWLGGGVNISDNNQNVVGAFVRGDVNINGDTTITSAEQRARSAQSEIQGELLDNFSGLGVTVGFVAMEEPVPFWDIRRANETELAYQDRAEDEFRDYIGYIQAQIALLDFSESAYSSFQRDLAHDSELAARLGNVYEQQNEAVDSLHSYVEELQHLLDGTLNDTERTARSLSLHQEKMANARMTLSYAVAHFCLTTAQQSDLTILSDSLALAGIDVALEPGDTGYRVAMQQAAEFAAVKTAVLTERTNASAAGEAREIDRRVNDPYLVLLREATGLPPTLTEAEVVALQNKTLALDETDPAKLFELAAFSYLESDGHAALLYFEKAIETGQLSPLQETFATLSIDRLENPENYEGSIGVMVAGVTAGDNFATAGLQVGDVILALDGEVVNEPLDIGSALAVAEGPVLLTVLSADAKQVVQVQPNESAGALLTQLIILNAIQL